MKNIFNKRIPTLFGILAIAIGIGVTSFLTSEQVFFTGQAGQSNEPKNVQISNVSDTSFTVSYTTEDAVFGSLNFGTNTSLGNAALDERDKTPQEHNVHVITVKSLTPKTSYLFSIISGQETFLNNGAMYSARTGPAIDFISEQKGNIKGKVVSPDGVSPKEALVYLSIPGAQVLSTLTKADGSYNFSLSLLRTTDLSSFHAVPSDTSVKLLVFGNSLNSQASLSSDEMSNIPTITLSQNYDFTLSKSPVSGSIPEATPSAELFPTSTPSGATASAPKILTPKKDQEFSDDQPLFKGTAQPNQEVEITIHSEGEISAKVIADGNGSWSYRPQSSLAPGTHTITIKTKDAFGIVKTITQQFTVFAAGSAVSESATPSATLAPTATPSPTPTLTITPTTTVTPFLTPTETAMPTPTAILPPVGNSTGAAVGIATVALMIAGSLLFIFTRLRI